MESISQERKTIIDLMTGIENVDVAVDAVRSLSLMAMEQVEDSMQWFDITGHSIPQSVKDTHVLLQCIFEKALTMKEHAKRSEEAFDAWKLARKAQEGATH